MTQLTIYSALDSSDVILDTTDFDTIAAELGGVGTTIERWAATHPISETATPDDILAAYAADIAKLKEARGYAAADVISIRPGNPNWPTLRQKFLAEHVHDEDEVRFFVSGSGAFYLHVGDKIYRIVGERNDLLSVPTGTRHWFDGGPDGDFTCIRLFTRQEGWVAHFTGDGIAENYPKFERAA